MTSRDNGVAEADSVKLANSRVSPFVRIDAVFGTRLGLASFAVFLVFGCVVYLNTWNTEFFLDGVHLIQTYDSAALREALTGNWEPNNWETPGYRPLSALFNHARSLLFGEFVLAHRFFLITLMALSLSLLTRAGVALGTGHWAGIAAGVFLLAAPNNYYHIAWLSDGLHIVPTLLGAVAIFAAARSPAAWGGAPWRCVLVHTAGVAALLAREEGVAMYGVAVVVALVRGPGPLWRRVLAYAVPAALLLVGFLVLRQALVPEAADPRRSHGALGGYFHTWSRSALHSINFMALRLTAGRTAWGVGLAALITAGLIFAPPPRRRVVALYIGFVLISLGPLAFVYRENIVLAPSLFAAMVLAMCVESVVRAAGRVPGAVLLAGAVLIVVLMVRENKIYQEIFHPYSAAALESQAWVLGDRNVHIPDVRRERMSRRLRAVGVPDVPYRDVRPEAERLVERCEGRRRPDGEQPFLARRYQWIYRAGGLTADQRALQ